MNCFDDKAKRIVINSSKIDALGGNNRKIIIPETIAAEGKKDSIFLNLIKTKSLTTVIKIVKIKRDRISPEGCFKNMVIKININVKAKIIFGVLNKRSISKII